LTGDTFSGLAKSVPSPKPLPFGRGFLNYKDVNINNCRVDRNFSYPNLFEVNPAHRRNVKIGSKFQKVGNMGFKRLHTNPCELPFLLRGLFAFYKNFGKISVYLKYCP
jgi:hypothetical protein